MPKPKWFSMSTYLKTGNYGSGIVQGLKNVADKKHPSKMTEKGNARKSAHALGEKYNANGVMKAAVAKNPRIKYASGDAMRTKPWKNN